MYRCENKCGPHFGRTTYYELPKDACPICGGKMIEEKPCNSLKHKGKINIGVKWNAQFMQVGLDKVYCSTRQSYLDACKHGRVIHAGTREISTREIDPVGAKD